MGAVVFFVAVCLMLAPPVMAEGTPQTAQDEDAELAQKLTNPIADLITIPVQMSYDSDIGPADDGWKLQTNIQPVIPLQLNPDWNLITRTILPVIYQDDILPGTGSQFGLGDTSVSLFFSPQSSLSAGGVLWGIGPICLLPTATDDLLGTKKWGAGPAGIVLTARGPWTIGMLANHVWSFAGDSERDDISNTFLQPFVAYTGPSAWTISVQTESTYNWKTENWSVPINIAVAKLVRFGILPVSLQAGVGYWAESPDAGPEGLRYRLQANFVLPKPK
ncbi:MAG: transporter [Desulfobacteraceae bacterium]|nr:transporter [Desulfobacteraceae bacterium]MBC2754096.1 transporter [Desulfobacteraceae bacterium]